MIGSPRFVNLSVVLFLVTNAVLGPRVRDEPPPEQ